jgi:transposase-like protein
VTPPSKVSCGSAPGDAKAWQTRPLEAVYAIIHLVAVVKIRDGQAVRNFACYLAIGVNLDGERRARDLVFKRPRAPSSGCTS